MASKKKNSALKTRGFGAANLNTGLQKAAALLSRGKLEEAQAVLTVLSKTYPQQPDILALSADVCLELNDMVGYAKACRQMLQANPKNAEAAYGLAGAYLETFRPLLALEAFDQALERFPNSQYAEKARQTVAKLDDTIEKMLLNDLNLPGEQGRAVALQHERGQMYLEQGDYQQARQAEQAALQIQPDFVAALNNLSLIHYIEGDLVEAIAVSQQVLEQQPDNIHALSNLVRYCWLNGQIEQAQAFAQRLKDSRAGGWEIWHKKVEGLSYLGDDGAIVEVFEQAKAAQQLDDTNAMFHHLVAVAMQRLGQTKSAQAEWKQALKQSPGFSLAEANLKDLKLPLGQSHGPWAFEMGRWIRNQDIEKLGSIAQLVSKSAKGEGQFKEAAQRYLTEHPELNRIFAALLDRGDPQGREFAFRFASAIETPELLAALRDFALGQRGPDQMRHQAAIKVSDAGLLSSELVRMWIQGQWREIALISYEFHDDPPFQHSPPVYNLLKQALPLLHRQDAQSAAQAEVLLQQAIELEPNSPDLWNNLAVAYQLQDRKAESEALIQQVAEQYPDYLLAQVSLAKRDLQQGEVEAAAARLKPLLTRKRFHIDDFAQFSGVYIALLQAQDQLAAARTWLNLWESVDPDNLALLSWKARLDSQNLLAKVGKIAAWGKPKTPK